MPAVNEIVATVSLVIQLKAGAIVGSASGFFYERSDKLFLVTNRHVCLDEKKGVAPDTLRLRLHTDAANLAKQADFDVALYANGAPTWRTHPKSKEIDVALVELPRTAMQAKFIFKAWSTKNFLPERYPLHPGEDVFIMGFPRAFHDTVHNLPVFRTAMIASTYPVPFGGLPLFLTDGNFHPGTSGSPVISKPKSTWVDDKGNTDIVTGTTYYLLGVHSGTVAPEVTGGEPVDLGAAWYANLVEEIAASF